MLGRFRRHGLVVVRCPCKAPQLSGRTQEFCFFPLQMACPVTRPSARDSLDSQDSAPAIRDSFLFWKLRRRLANDNQLQEFQQFGDAPVRQAPAGLDKQRYADGEPAHHKHHHSHHPHRLHLPHHRHTRSKEEPPTPPPKDPGHGNLTRPLTYRHDSSSSIRMLKDTVSSPVSSRNTLPIRGSSPTPSSSSGVSRSETMPDQRSPANSSSARKGGLLSKLRRNKGDHDSHGLLSHLPGSTSSLQRAPTNDSSGYRSDIYAPKDTSRQ